MMAGIEWNIRIERNRSDGSDGSDRSNVDCEQIGSSDKIRYEAKEVWL